MFKPPALIGFGLIATLGLIDARPGRAVCLSSGDAGANSCFTFDGTTTTAKQTYTTSNLISNKWFQLGFYSSDSVSYSISNVEFSQNDTTYISLGNTSTGTGGFAAPNYFAPLQAPGGSVVNIPFYLRYTIGGPVAAGTTITSKLLSNNNGFTNGGSILLDNSNNYVSVSRDSSVPSTKAVPAPLPILGAAAAFARVKRFRRNSKLLSHMG